MHTDYDLTDLRNDIFDTRSSTFDTFIELANGGSTSGSEVAFMALEAGNVYAGGSVIGEAKTQIIDFHDDNGESRTTEPEWHTINLENSYSNPVVIAQLASTTGSHPSHIRIKDVTNSSFKVWIEEWDDQRSSNHHNHELVSYVVLEAGEHELADGRTIVAKEAIVDGQFHEVPYGITFKSTPEVFSQTQSYQDHAQAWVRQQVINTASAQLMVQNEQGNHDWEDVGMIAIGTELVIPTVQVTLTVGNNGSVESNGVTYNTGVHTITVNKGEDVEFTATPEKVMNRRMDRTRIWNK